MNFFRNIFFTVTFLSFISFISLFPYSLSAQEDEPAKIKQNKIKVQKVSKYKYDWGEPVLQGDLIFSKTYDENGNITEIGRAHV